MKTYQVGDKIKVRRSGEHGEIVGVYKIRYEVHITDGKRKELNPFYREYEIEHSKEARLQ